MEGLPQTRIIGPASEEQKEGRASELRDRLWNHSNSWTPEQREKIQSMEVEKTPFERDLIAFGNEYTNGILAKFDVEPFDIPEENIHIVSQEFYRGDLGEKGGSSALTARNREAIFLNESAFRRNDIKAGLTAAHELLHMKEHFTDRVSADGKIRPYRQGVSTGSPRDGHKHFKGLNEAIVAETERRALPALLELPYFEEEREWRAHPEWEKRRQLLGKLGVPMDDIVWINPGGDRRYEVLSYPKQREVLRYICMELSDAMPETFATADDAYEAFLRADITGALLPIGRSMDTVFGEGGFRALGMMGEGC